MEMRKATALEEAKIDIAKKTLEEVGLKMTALEDGKGGVIPAKGF